MTASASALRSRSGMSRLRQGRRRRRSGEAPRRRGFAAAVATLTGEQLRRAPMVRSAPKKQRRRLRPPPARQGGMAVVDDASPSSAASPRRIYARRAAIPGPLPPTLAFLPAHTPARHPAMIAAFGVADEPENVDAVHLTLLTPDGSGKADVSKPKLFVGRPLGRPIVLAPIGDTLALAVTEGIEDGLSVPPRSTWACGRQAAAIDADARRCHPALCRNRHHLVASRPRWPKRRTQAGRAAAPARHRGLHRGCAMKDVNDILRSKESKAYAARSGAPVPTQWRRGAARRQ